MTFYVLITRILNCQLVTLILKKTNTSPRKSPFLDLDITITSNQFITKVYDKREDFNFDPHLDTPNTPAYMVSSFHN